MNYGIVKKDLLCTLFAAIVALSGCGKNVSTQNAAAPIISQSVMTWQEQYDLGMRYLTEGNYHEAIIAFTAAIEIDPKQVEAYIARGDAYVGNTKQNNMDKTDYSKAAADYLMAIELDDKNAEVYGKLADLYVAMEDLDGAIEALRRGVEITGHKELQAKLEELLQGEEKDTNEQSPKISARATIIRNSEVYWEEWRRYAEQYEHPEDKIFCAIDTYGIRFETPITTEIAGKTVVIEEARLHRDNVFTEEQLPKNGMGGTVVGKVINVTGTLCLSKQTTEIAEEHSREGALFYNYRPNGDYEFQIESAEEIE